MGRQYGMGHRGTILTETHAFLLSSICLSPPPFHHIPATIIISFLVFLLSVQEMPAQAVGRKLAEPNKTTLKKRVDLVQYIRSIIVGIMRRERYKLFSSRLLVLPTPGNIFRPLTQKSSLKLHDVNLLQHFKNTCKTKCFYNFIFKTEPVFLFKLFFKQH